MLHVLADDGVGVGRLLRYTLLPQILQHLIPLNLLITHLHKTKSIHDRQPSHPLGTWDTWSNRWYEWAWQNAWHPSARSWYTYACTCRTRSSWPSDTWGTGSHSYRTTYSTLVVVWGPWARVSICSCGGCWWRRSWSCCSRGSIVRGGIRRISWPSWSGRWTEVRARLWKIGPGRFDDIARRAIGTCPACAALC